MRKIALPLSIIVAVMALTATSLWPQPSDSSSTTSWLDITQDKVQYILILMVAVLAFVLGGLVRPLLTNAGNALLRWVQGWRSANSWEDGARSAASVKRSKIRMATGGRHEQ